MNSTARLFVCGLLAPVLATSADKKEIRFAPKEGSKLERRLELSYDFTLDDFSLVVDGEDVGAVMGGFDLSVAGEGLVAVIDEYVALAEGRPKELLRTYSELSSSTKVEFSSDFGGQDQDVDGSSELEGRTVRFQWDDDEGDFVKTYADGEHDDLLDGLTEDMDYRALLPRGPVAPGDTWEVSLKDLQSVVAPGGNMQILPEGSEMEDMEGITELMGDNLGKLAELFEGSCTCTYVGQSEVDPALAEVSFEAQVEADLDLADAMSDMIETVLRQSTDEEIPDFSIDSADFSIELEGNGTLLWNCVENRLASVSYTLDAVISLDFAASMEVADESHEAELFLEMSGSTSQALGTSE